jgi:hypothetical protein
VRTPCSRIVVPVLAVTVGVLAFLAYAVAVRAEDTVSEGAPITPEFARTLYARIAPLREPDGCRLTRFDTSRYRITIGLLTAAGGEQLLELATRSGLVPTGRTAGEWAIAVPAPLARECPTTVAAIERILAKTDAPTGAWYLGSTTLSPSFHYLLLAATILLVLVGTVHVLYREVATGAAPAGAVVALVLLWALALGLRLWLSPRTFLHEYYHVAETVPAYLSGELAPGYGKTGPTLFRLVRLVVGEGEDVRIIFLTNAVVSSLAIPAAAMLVLAVTRSWPQALCAALLLAVLPQHLRFSAAEDLFVQAITFGLWSLALFASYHRTRRLEDALLGALTASLATQARPEMIFFPAVVVTFLFFVQPRAWRVLFAWPTLVAGAVFAVLLVPHALDVLGTMREARAPSPVAPSLRRWVDTLVLFDPRITPLMYPLLLLVGAAWAAIRRPGWVVWVVAVYVGFTLFTLSIFDNPQYHLRAQNLPTSYLVLLAAGAVPVWMAAWRRHRRLGAVLGIVLLATSAIGVVARWRGFVGELKDQQLEWAFLERHVSELPARATLITAVETGGHNLDAFPEFLLTKSGRRYALVDVRRAAEGAVPWPEPTGELLFYQGMFCYFAFDDEPAPDPMTRACRTVHERYAAAPLLVEDLHTEGYSHMRYAQGGRGVFRIGFYRLTPRT